MDRSIQEYIDICKKEDRTTLTEIESKSLLADFGMPMVSESVVLSERDAIEEADDIGYPVVLKGVSPDMPHKSEEGIIQLGIENPAQLKSSYNKIYDTLQNHSHNVQSKGIVVQPQINGRETILGMNYDNQFGPVCLFGLGGIFVEIYNDTCIKIPPITIDDSRQMINELVGSPILHGYRSDNPVNIDKLANIIKDFSDFCMEVEKYVDEIDINPILVSDQQIVGVDALIRFKADILDD